MDTAVAMHLARTRWKTGLATGLALMLVCWACDARIVVLNIDLSLDQVAVGQRAKLGDHDQARVFYDDATIDPKTHIARVLQMQQREADRWMPETLDPVAMPMFEAWLD